MNQKSCIILFTYPDTENKLKILQKSIDSVKYLGLPIFLFSNMDIDKEYLQDVHKFVTTGQNELVSASDFLSIEDITLARNKTKYRYHLTYDENIITYIPISYGTEKSYYWALIKLFQKSFDYVFKEGYTDFMFLQELELLDENINLCKQYFKEVNELELDGLVAVDPNMGENHLSDYVFFGKTKWWSELFQSMSVHEFYKITFPNWGVEEYFYKKCKEKYGKIKFKIRTNLEEWEKPFYRVYPPNWIRDDIDCSTREPFNLFFPNLNLTDFSNNWDTPKFNVDKSLIVSIRPINDFYQIFVWNREISENDKKINLSISFPNENELDVTIPTIYFDLLPGVWSLNNFSESLKDRKVILNYSYEDNNIIVNNIKTYYI